MKTRKMKKTSKNNQNLNIKDGCSIKINTYMTERN